jgi:lipopolysaccharide biosynthesis glycosyltransferase
MNKLVAMADDATAIYVVNLCDEQWKNMPTFGGETIDLLASITDIGQGQWGDVRFNNTQDADEGYKFMINLRLFFPDIFASGLLPEELRAVDFFLWLDSDLIVYRDLLRLFTIGEERPNQRMFGSNIDHDRDDSNYQEIEIANNGTISGGVVLWNMKQIIADCGQIGENVFKQTIKQAIMPESFSYDYFFDEDKRIIMSESFSYVYGSEEDVFTEYIFGNLQDSQSIDSNPCFLPYSYNVTNIDLLLLHFADQTDSISIFHWDSMAKPWKDDAKGSETDESGAEDSEKALFRQQIRSWKEIAANVRSRWDN